MWAALLALLWFIIKWTLILMWRFFSGAHMNAAIYNDSTWFKDASRKYIKVRRKYTWWNRKARLKRAGWRNAIFWPCLILSVGFAVDPWGMFFILGMLSPGLYFLGHQKVKLFFFQPVAGTHSDGVTYQHWVMRYRYRVIVEHLKPNSKRRHPKHPGLLPDIEKRKKGPITADIPIEYVAAVRNELREALDDQPAIELKLLLDPEVDMIT
jgi:hypothetical protein